MALALILLIGLLILLAKRFGNPNDRKWITINVVLIVSWISIAVIGFWHTYYF